MFGVGQNPALADPAGIGIPARPAVGAFQRQRVLVVRVVGVHVQMRLVHMQRKSPGFDDQHIFLVRNPDIVKGRHDAGHRRRRIRGNHPCGKYLNPRHGRRQE